MGRGGGGEEKAPSNQGSSNPNVRISVEERRAPVVPGTENKVPGTIHSEAPPRQIRAASPSPLLPLLPTFVNVSSHKRADGNRESSTSWLMMLHVALSSSKSYSRVNITKCRLRISSVRFRLGTTGRRTKEIRSWTSRLMMLHGLSNWHTVVDSILYSLLYLLLLSHVQAAIHSRVAFRRRPLPLPSCS